MPSQTFNELSAWRVTKRDGRKVNFSAEKITQALVKAGLATAEFNEAAAQTLTIKVLSILQQVAFEQCPNVETNSGCCRTGATKFYL